jgi:hypothetical protein
LYIIPKTNTFNINYKSYDFYSELQKIFVLIDLMELHNKTEGGNVLLGMAGDGQGGLLALEATAKRRCQNPAASQICLSGTVMGCISTDPYDSWCRNI